MWAMARILVVEDEESIRRALDKRLRKLGHEVVTAQDGVEGLQVLGSQAFDLLITDFRMPRMDGLELLRNVKERPEKLPVIMITGTSTENPEVFIERGAQAYLLKPIAREDLEATLTRVLSLPPKP
jgi:CheY-like chemotaxis protein